MSKLHKNILGAALTILFLIIFSGHVMSSENKKQATTPAPDEGGNKLNSHHKVTLAQQANGFIDAYLTPKLSTPVISTPEDFGLDYEEVTFTTQDGVMLSGWLVKSGKEKVIIQAPPVTANRSGIDIGDSGNQLNLVKTAKTFADAGYSVLMFDARNHGKSEVGPQPFIIGTIDDAPDFVAAVDYIGSRSEYRNSNIGIHAICFGSNATASAFGLEDGLQKRKNLKAISLTQPASWGMLLRNNPDVPDEFVDEINKQLKERGARDLDILPLEYAKNITVPTLLVQNQNDPHFSRSFIDEFYNQISSEKKMLWIDGEKDRSHAYYYETEHPEKLIEWFDRYV